MTSHVAVPATRSLGDQHLFRVARADAPLRPSVIDPDAASTNAGNRFDVVGAGVLYLASEPTGGFAETLAQFRLPAKIRAVLAKDEEWGSKFVVCGGLPADWRARRLLVEVATPASLPFVDLEHPDTLEFFTAELADLVASFGIAQLDVSDVRSGNRRLTRAIAKYAFDAEDQDGPLYSGVRFMSRLGDYECWALFYGTPVTVVAEHTIAVDNSALSEVAATFGLRVF